MIIYNKIMCDLKSEVLKVLTDQVHREYEAALFYRQAYHWFELNQYPGSARYMKKEAEDEVGHA